MANKRAKKAKEVAKVEIAEKIEVPTPAPQNEGEGKITLNKNAIIAAILNLLLVGLGYAYLKQYKKAIASFFAYVIVYLIIFYISTYFPLAIWLGLPITLFFVYDAYKSGDIHKESNNKKDQVTS